MRISYNKLWKMLIDKNMKKSDLKEQAGISSASIAKLGKGDNITTDVLPHLPNTGLPIRGHNGNGGRIGKEGSR